MFEVLMIKNENNSYVFMKKMVENIKLIKDVQFLDEFKINEVRYVLGQWVLRCYRKNIMIFVLFVFFDYYIINKIIEYF